MGAGWAVVGLIFVVGAVKVGWVRGRLGGDSEEASGDCVVTVDEELRGEEGGLFSLSADWFVVCSAGSRDTLEVS